MTPGIDVDQPQGVGSQTSVTLSVGLTRIEYLLFPGRPQQYTLLPVLVVHSTPTEAKCTAPEALNSGVAGQYEEVAPAQSRSILFLHRPEQSSRLVKVIVVCPAPLWLKPHLSMWESACMQKLSMSENAWTSVKQWNMVGNIASTFSESPAAIVI